MSASAYTLSMSWIFIYLFDESVFLHRRLHLWASDITEKQLQWLYLVSQFLGDMFFMVITFSHLHRNVLHILIGMSGYIFQNNKT